MNANIGNIKITVDNSAEEELLDRVQRLTQTGPPMRMSPKVHAIQFLRGVGSRATMTLPAFYLYLGSTMEGSPSCLIDDYPGVVLRHSIQFSSISTISLSCRKAFDHSAKGMTGANFAKISDETLLKTAEYWSDKSKRTVQDAFDALCLLRIMFKDCAKSVTDLFRGTAPLGRRIGLLKQYADRSAAHLSLENYEISPLDCAHVVAAITIIGEIIRSFDDPKDSSNYFDELDDASWRAAKQLFPATPERRLFADMKIEMQSRLCWQFGVEQGQQMLLKQLPYAIGWF